MSFAVATGHALTTHAASEVLRAGGTAVDGAIAAAAMSFVAEPVLSQPMGGGFAMIAKDAVTPPAIFDAFVQTPPVKSAGGDLDLATITVDFGTDTQDFHIGAGTVAVPCLMPALFALHEQAGRIPMPELMAAAVKAAREGIAITPFQALVTSLVTPILTDRDDVSALHAPDGAAPDAGKILSNRDLADVLEVGALEGARFFVEGEVGQALVGLEGGHISMSALKAARPITRTPLRVTRQGQEIALNPPPSLGGVQIALALTALPAGPGPETVAQCLEEIAMARKARKVDDQPEAAARLLLDPDLVDRLRAALREAPAARKGTTHISVIDAKGMAVGLTLSNGAGSGRLIPGTGIMPNNMLGEEDLVPGGPTTWAAGTRLASMMCPTWLRAPDGTTTILGSGGSNRIRSALTTTLISLIDEGAPPEEALRTPRMHMEGSALSFEDSDKDEGRRAALLSRWPEATVWDRPHMYFGGVHIARKYPDGRVEAAGDARRSGTSAIG